MMKSVLQCEVCQKILGTYDSSSIGITFFGKRDEEVKCVQCAEKKQQTKKGRS